MIERAFVPIVGGFGVFTLSKLIESDEDKKIKNIRYEVLSLISGLVKVFYSESEAVSYIDYLMDKLSEDVPPLDLVCK